MSELQIYQKMASGLKGDIRAMEFEAKDLDMTKHPHFAETLSFAKAELTNCEKQIKTLGDENER